MTIEKPRDGYLVACEHDEKVVQWLARVGGLTSDQLRRLVWPDCKQGQRLAQRTLRRLIGRDEVLRRPLPNGGSICVLTERGAARARELGLPASARGGRDLRWTQPLHRFLCNEIALHHIAQGLDVWSEYEIQRGLAPFRKLRGLVPDLLTFDNPDDPSSLAWYEIENSVKSPRRLAQLLDLAYRLTASPDGYKFGKYAIKWFVFVTPNSRSFDAVVRAIRRYFGARDGTAPRALTRIEVWRVNLTPRLRWGGIEKIFTAQELLEKPASGDEQG